MLNKKNRIIASVIIVFMVAGGSVIASNNSNESDYTVVRDGNLVKGIMSAEDVKNSEIKHNNIRLDNQPESEYPQPDQVDEDIIVTENEVPDEPSNVQSEAQPTETEKPRDVIRSDAQAGQSGNAQPVDSSNAVTTTFTFGQ